MTATVLAISIPIPWPLVILAVVIAVAVAIMKSPAFKGMLGEFLVNLTMKLFLDKQKYHLVKNVTLPTEDGTTQVDHVIVSRHGIFVIETKNMNGFISGGERQPEWTQSFGKQNKFKFQNPLRQNYKHTRTLADLLGVPHEAVKSIVMFVGGARLRAGMPENVMTSGVVGYIKGFKEELFSEEEVAAILQTIKDKRLAPGFKTHRDHVQHVREVVAEKRSGGVEQSEISVQKNPVQPDAPASSSESVSAAVPEEEHPPQCPKCGKTMVLRTARRGKNAGGKFWGCPGYPGCKGIVNVS